MRWLSTAARTLRAEARVVERADQRQGDDERDRDQEQPVFAERQAEHADRAAQEGGRLDRLLQRAVDIGCDRDRDEGDADGQQHLVEVGGAVQAAVENTLEHDARRRRGEEGRRQGRQERPVILVYQGDGDVAAEHGEGAVRQIDEIHQPERHRQADRQHEQQHAVGQAVEQDTEDGRQHGESVCLYF